MELVDRRPEWARTLWLHVVEMMPNDSEEDDGTLDRIERVVKDALCAEFGHEIEDDHCGIPEHRYCVYCNRLEGALT